MKPACAGFARLYDDLLNDFELVQCIRQELRPTPIRKNPQREAEGHHQGASTFS
jgi:hypothetical protein